MQTAETQRTIALDGERVRAQRLRAGLTREALSAKSSGADALSVATIKRAESGKPLYASSAASLARVLEAPLDQLLPALTARATQSTPPPRSTPGASVAVMPFTIDDASRDQRIFVDGFVEELINGLSCIWFPVIARGSTFSWADADKEPTDLHKALGADYLLKGSLRSDGANYRTLTQLVESESGRVVWSASFDTPTQELFSLRDQIVRRVVSEVGNQVLAAEADRAARLDTEQLDAWRIALRGVWHFHRCTAEDLRQARGYLQRAIAQDPQLAFARYVLMLSHQHELLNQWSPDPRATLGEMKRAGIEFERAAPGNHWMYVATAYTAVALGDRSDAEGRLLEALQVDANSIQAHSLYGQVLAMRGHCDQGLHELGLARTLSPRDPGTWAILMTTSLAHFAAGRYEPAVEWARRAVANRPQVPFTYAALAASLALRGDVDEARATLGKLVERHGQLARRGVTSVISSTDPEIAGRFMDGLRLAGMSDS